MSLLSWRRKKVCQDGVCPLEQGVERQGLFICDLE